MSTSSFTPGPWMRDGISVTTYAPASQPRKTICITHPDVTISGLASHARMQANARLIAAAPELLDVVRRFMRAADDKGHVNLPALESACNRARAALAKARGEPA